LSENDAKTPGMMRLFVAVNVGPSITDAMAAELPRLRAEAERCGLKISWSRPEGWHATIKFLGNVDAERVRAIGGRMERVAAAVEPFATEATGVMTFPPRSRKPNVVVVALSDDGRFSELAERMDEALAEDGFEREQRRFHPHVTFGRVRDARGWRRFEPAIQALEHRSFGSGRVSALTLYSSKLGDGPAHYEAIAAATLGARTASAVGA
jgi:2'-5' RNA ligase